MDPYLYIENDRAVEKPTGHTDGKNEPRGVFWRGGAVLQVVERPLAGISLQDP